MFVHPIGNAHPMIAPLVGAVTWSVHGCTTTTGSGIIQVTVAVASPVAPCVFSNVKVYDHVCVNVYSLLPLLLVIVTPVLENPVNVAVTDPVVFAQLSGL